MNINNVPGFVDPNIILNCRCTVIFLQNVEEEILALPDPNVIYLLPPSHYDDESVSRDFDNFINKIANERG